MRFFTLCLCLAVLSACSSSNDDGDGSSSGVSTGTDDFAEFVLRCDPSADDPCPAVGGTCCSDDPMALDLYNLDADVLPNYQGRGGEGTPVFSGGNNPLSRHGYCLVEEPPPAFALAEINAQGCRVPCNPTWSYDDIEAACGAGSLCCQTVELQPTDCVLDPDLGDAGCYRPVTGNDIVGLGGLDATDWASDAHATHQDPSGLNCQLFATSIPAEVGIEVNELLAACFNRLTVANQRGSCFSTAELAGCPLASPTYVDACEQQNANNQLTGC